MGRKGRLEFRQDSVGLTKLIFGMIKAELSRARFQAELGNESREITRGESAICFVATLS